MSRFQNTIGAAARFCLLSSSSALCSLRRACSTPALGRLGCRRQAPKAPRLTLDGIVSPAQHDNIIVMRKFLLLATLLCFSRAGYGTRVEQTHANPKTEVGTRLIDSHLNWSRLLQLAQGEPAVKEVVIICHDDGVFIAQDCAHTKFELSACGIKVHWIDGDTEQKRADQLNAILNQMSGDAPVLYMSHGTVDPSRPHQVRLRNGKDHYLVDSSRIMTQLKGGFPQNPILFHTCGAGNCVDRHPEMNLAGPSHADTEASAVKEIGVRRDHYLSRMMGALNPLLCSKKLFNEVASKPGVLTGADLNKFFDEHPLYRYRGIFHEAKEVDASDEAAVTAAREELEKSLAKKKAECPQADVRPKACWPAEKPCPTNFTVTVHDRVTSCYTSYLPQIYRRPATDKPLELEETKKHRDFLFRRTTATAAECAALTPSCGPPLSVAAKEGTCGTLRESEWAAVVCRDCKNEWKRTLNAIAICRSSPSAKRAQEKLEFPTFSAKFQIKAF